MISLNENIIRDFTCHNPTTGQVSDADFIPTCEVFEDTTDIPMITPVVVKRLGWTGDYRVSFVTSAANGFEVGKSYNTIVTATVNAITAKSRILAFNIEEPVAAPAFFDV